MTTSKSELHDDGIPGVTRRHKFSDFYHEHTNFQFIKHSRRWLILSGTLMVISIAALFLRGLNLGIEFEGGTSWQVPVAGRSPSVPEVRDLLSPLNIGDPKVSVLSGQGEKSVRVQAEVLHDPGQEFSNDLAQYANVENASVNREDNGNGGATFTVAAKNSPQQAQIESIARRNDITGAKVTVDGKNITVVVSKMPIGPIDRVTNALADYANKRPTDVSVSTVGPTWGSEVSNKAIRALVIFFIILAVYLSVRFEWKMSASAIVAVIHDIIFTVGVYALFQFEVTPATVTAFLTILGFSLYDTVVVFDKVKENEATLNAVGRSTYSDMTNRSLNSVLMRSLSTSIVALMPVVSLLVIGSLVMGATTLEDFALALLVGLFIGAYSSIFVAAPILAWWKEKEPRYRAMRARLERRPGEAAPAPTLAAAATEEIGVPVGAGARTRGDGAGRPGPTVGAPRPAPPRPRQQRRRKRR